MCDTQLWADMAPDLARLGEVRYGNVYQDDTLDGMARRVLAESPEQFVLVGFSMGGFVARVLALIAPERVRGVAFVASSARGYSDEETARRKQGYLPTGQHSNNSTDKAQLAAPGGNRTPRSSGGNAMGLHPDRERDPVLLDRLRSMQRRLGPAVRAKQAALVRREGYADLERIACRSLVVACRQDRLRNFAETERMAHHLPHSRFEVLEDCGHMAPLERPHELAALLADWIAREGL